MFILLAGFFVQANSDWNPDWKTLKSAKGWRHDRTVQSEDLGPIQVQIKEIDGNPCL